MPLFFAEGLFKDEGSERKEKQCLLMRSQFSGVVA